VVQQALTFMAEGASRTWVTVSVLLRTHHHAIGVLGAGDGQQGAEGAVGAWWAGPSALRVYRTGSEVTGGEGHVVLGPRLAVVAR
jgi:hypothetical protein